MSARTSRILGSVTSAVIIPIKSFDTAKGRLASELSPDQREVLARRMAATVIASAHSLPVYVVCDDADVAAFAVNHGALVVWRPAQGLNVAVADGVEAVAADGHDRAIVAHGDLPRANDLTWLADVEGVVIVTDRRADGTNVMSIPTTSAFDFAYGEGSGALHKAEAERQGLSVEIVHDEALGWDVDVPEDLEIIDDLEVIDARGKTVYATTPSAAQPSSAA